MKIGRLAVLVVSLALLLSCAVPAPVTKPIQVTAQFEVTKLDIVPPGAHVGEVINISIHVKKTIQFGYAS